MSRYTVEFRTIQEVDVYHAADILWSEHALIRKQMPFVQYRDLLIADLVHADGLLCYCDGRLVAALAVGRLGPDFHIAGTGVIVYSTMTSRFHPKATRLLYRSLVALVKQGGGSWYQTTRRVSDVEFHSKYRRIANGQESTQDGSQV